MDSNVTNIAGYKFVDLDDRENRRERYKAACIEREIKGRILIAPEGINIAIAGSAQSIASFLEFLRNEPEFSDLEVKYSYSKNQPFRRLTVKSKGHIIPFNREIRPQDQRAPSISPAQLKKWLDEKKEDLVVLDVRNHYETKEGKFKDSQTLPIRYFRDLPDLFEKIQPNELKNLKNKTVVTVCTGGIKTEKATPWLIKQGVENAYQLDGGIIKYLEEFGHEHFEGRCFVFDHRVCLDASLQEPDSKMNTSDDPFWDQKKDAEPKDSPKKTL